MKHILIALAVLLACVAVGNAQAAPAPVVIYVNNATTEISQAQLDNWLPALQASVDDLGRYWNVSAVVVDSHPVPGDWVVNLTDAPAPCSWSGCALGYHWYRGAMSYAEIFVPEILNDNESITQTITHEVDEALIDPTGDRGAQTRGGFTLVEIGDPVSPWFYFTPAADGSPVEVSDFVTPAWFSGGRGPYDRDGRLKRAGQLAPGGYIAKWNPDEGWIETFN
jgi:hypothetical protein